jgi:predicted dehydrogenase
MLRAGVVGLGLLGQKYLRLMANDPRIRIVGVCDIDKQKVKQVCQQYQVQGFTELSEFLDLDMDFVYIATPDFAHTEPAVRAAERGFNLLIEKPLATSTAEAEQIVQAVRKSGVKAKVSFCNRWNPPFVAAKKAVEEGEIGEVISIYARLNDTIFVPTKMLKWASQTSPGWFLMSHTFDLARWFIGSEAVEVFGIGQKKVLKQEYQIDTYDNLYAVVRFENGAIAVLESGWILPESFPFIIDFKFQIIGTKGCIHINTHDQMVHLAGTKYQHLGTIDIDVNRKPRGQLAFSFEEFIDALLENREPEATVEDGLANTRVLEAVHIAADSGGAVIKVKGNNA